MVTFNSNGGSTVASQSVLEGNKAIIPSNPTRERYNFSSWTLNGNKLEVGKSSNVKTGEAKIRTVIEDDKVEEFTINILRLDEYSKTKNILFEITDNRLLEKTGGIIQGMSGSPIIQDNKIIGAVNYVIVNSTAKGYGVFITTMLEEGEK